MSGGARVVAQSPAVWQFENVAEENLIPGCVFGMTLAGFEYGPDGRPVLAWREENECGGKPRVHWTRQGADGWSQTEFLSARRYQGGAEGDYAHQLALRKSDGNPFFIYADVGPFNDVNTYRDDLSAYAAGIPSSTILEALVGPAQCAGLNYSLAFGPSDLTPQWSTGLANCSGGGPIRINGETLDATVFNPRGSLAVGTDGTRHLLWINDRNVFYTRWPASAPLEAPQQLFTDNTSNNGEGRIAIDAAGTLHAIVRGPDISADWDLGAIVYLTSTDGGTTWSPWEYVDPHDDPAVQSPWNGNTDMSLAVDADGVPAVTFWRWNSELWYARRDGPGGTWTQQPVMALPIVNPVRGNQLRFDPDGNPVIAFYDPVIRMMRLARPVPQGVVVPVDVAVTVSAAPAVLPSGAATTFTLSVTNKGTTNLDRIVLTNRLPDGATSVGASPAPDADGRWTFALTSGASKTFTISAIAPFTEGWSFDVASVATDVADDHPHDNAATAGLLVRSDQCYVPHDASSGLTGWWRGDGSAVNGVTGQPDGTAAAGVSYGPAAVGDGFTFNGTTGAVFVYHDDDNFYYPVDGSFTVQAYIKTTSPDGHIATRYECRSFGCGPTAWFLSLDGSGHLAAYVRDRNDQFIDFKGTHVINDGVFHHVALVLDRANAEARLYVDGVVDAATPFTIGTINDSNGPNTPVVIGAYMDFFGRTSGLFNGVIDEAAIYNRALSASEISAVSAAPSLPACTNVDPPSGTDASPIRNGIPESRSQFDGVGMILPSATHEACTATLISPFVVLTAAHCLRDDSPDPVFEFSLGAGRTARVTDIRVHPLFNTVDGIDLAFDVALASLDRAGAASWTDIIPATLRADPPVPVVEATAIGFGETSAGAGSGRRVSGTLLVTSYVDGENANGPVPDAFLEVNSGSADQMFCPEGAGGPLFYEDQVVGVASFRYVETCPEAGPGYYVNVSRVADWIEVTADDLQNRPPTAVDDHAELTFTTGSVDVFVLENDTDPDGDTLLAEAIVTEPQHGQVTLFTPQLARYRADYSYAGLDTFSYRVRDGHGGTSIATVTISTPPQQTVDLSLVVSSPVPTEVGIPQVTITVSNAGPLTATNVVVQGSTLDGNFPQAGIVDPSGGDNCLIEDQHWACTLDSIAPGTQRSLQAYVVPLTENARVFDTTYWVTSDQIDLDLANNQALLQIVVPEEPTPIRNGTPESRSQFDGVGMILPSATHGACTATLIGPSLVLTAAQCLRDDSLDPVFEFSLGAGRTARVTDIRVHPLFNTVDGLNLVFDVALASLDQAVTASWTNIIPATLRADLLSPVVEATAIGFGETSAGAGSGRRVSGTLLVTSYINGEDVNGPVPDAFLEVNPGSADQMFCQTGVGGPLFYNDQVVGVASFRFVETCAEAGPGYYINLGRVADWIHATADALVNHPPIASDVNLTTQNDVPITVEINGTDPDGDQLTAELVGNGAAGGQVTQTGPMSFLFTPDPAFTGRAFFFYRLRDAESFSIAATVNIDVTPPPIVHVDVVERITVSDAVLATPSVMITVAETIHVDDGVTVRPAVMIDVIEPVHVIDSIATAVGNTPVGNNVTVPAIGPQPGVSPISVTFPSVTQPGDTTYFTQQNAFPPPDGFRYGTPPLTFDISTTADYTAPIHVCVNYGAALYLNPKAIRLFHYEGGVWVDRTVSLNTQSHIVCADVSSLSPFALAEPEDLEGRISGGGELTAGDKELRFTFHIEERQIGVERGALALTIRTPKSGNKKAERDEFESKDIDAINFWADSAVFKGTGTWNGTHGYTFEAFAADAGEPGRGRDQLEITIRDAQGAVVATANGVLTGGNIQSKRLRQEQRR